MAHKKTASVQGIESMEFKLVGIPGLPTIFNNGQAADPLNTYAKQMATIAKAKKTDAIQEEMAYLQFASSLFIDEKGPYWPGANLKRMLKDGATKSKKGKDVVIGIMVDDAQLMYEGPRTIDELWEDKRFVLRCLARANQKATIVTTRAWFANWTLNMVVHYDTSVLSAGEITAFVRSSGRVVGLGGWRPEHGRFTI